MYAAYHFKNAVFLVDELAISYWLIEAFVGMRNMLGRAPGFKVGIRALGNS